MNRSATKKGVPVKKTVDKQRALQDKADALERQGKAKKKPVQAGTSKQPEPPLPAQHLRKPGRESELDEAPRFLAPDYRGSGKLEGMKAIVTGGDSGIGRAVAVLFAREGADVAILYLNEDQDAEELRMEEAAMHGGRAGARAAMQEQDRHALGIAALLPIDRMSPIHRQHAAGVGRNLGEQVGA